ncbi:MAG: hypothetical protein ACLUUO_01835 [Sellimonas intestinalis]
MNYEEAVSYINELQMFARKHTLDHTRAFLSYLGTPQEKKKMIHVAGTNGKGSVCRYLQALLIGGETHRIVYIPSSDDDSGADLHRGGDDIQKAVPYGV